MMHDATLLSVAAAGVFVLMLAALSWIDIKQGLLPDALTLSLMWSGLLINSQVVFTSTADSIYGAAVGYGLLWTANQIYRWRAGQDGMGYGDFKLMAALGAWLGVEAVPWVLIGACSLGALAAVGYRWVRGAAVQRVLPFGPFLSVGGVAALVWVFSR